ncbi:MAG: hypothetical protein NXI24_15065 [bacterium]|nr:hypothetical protein [bacterium]
MRILLDEDFLPGFLPGAVVHMVMLFSNFDIWRWDCGGPCDAITYYDIPISLFYFFMPDIGIAIFSLSLGSILWGFYGYAALKILRKIFQLFGVGS